MRRLYVFLILTFLFGFTPVQAQGELNVFLAASSDALGAGDAIDYTLMVSNTGAADLNNVNLDVQLPEQIARFFTRDVVGDFSCGSNGCNPNEVETWSVGTLAPGEARQFTYFTSIAANSPPGDATTTIIASADNISDIILMHDVVVDSSPLMRLSLVPGPGPAVPGESFSYTLTYGNVGTTSPTEVVLTMPVPTGSIFQSATGGGTESEGIVTWMLGTVGVGAGGRIEMTVIPDAAATTLEAEAALDSGIATELVVNSEAVTAVGLREALRFDYGVSQNAVGRSGSLFFTLTATNTSSTNDLTGVEVVFRLPGQIARFFTRDVVGDFSCGSNGCNPNEVETWSVGTLAPGQSRTIIMPTGIANNAQQGEVLRAFYHAVADGLEDQTGGTDLVVDPSPIARFQMIPGPSPAIPGESFTYTVLFSNIGFEPTDLVLEMTLPEGTTFNSATGGVTETDGVVRWQAGEVAAESVGRVQVIVDVDPVLPAGSLLDATAQLDPGSATEYVLHASAATPVGEESALDVTYTADIEFGSPGDPFDLTMVAENAGQVDFTDVGVEFRLPGQIVRFFTSDVIGDFSCGSNGCNPNEVETWSVGTLAPGQSRTIIMPTGIASSAQEGSFLLSPTIVTATGSGESVRYLYMLLGDEFVVSNDSDGVVAESLALGVEAYPSPFVGEATFALSLPSSGDVRVVVYDVLGRLVGTVVQEPLAAGQHEVQWNARNLPSGVYFYRLSTPQGARTGSLVKVK